MAFIYSLSHLPWGPSTHVVAHLKQPVGKKPIGEKPPERPQWAFSERGFFLTAFCPTAFGRAAVSPSGFCLTGVFPLLTPACAWRRLPPLIYRCVPLIDSFHTGVTPGGGGFAAGPPPCGAGGCATGQIFVWPKAGPGNFFPKVFSRFWLWAGGLSWGGSWWVWARGKVSWESRSESMVPLHILHLPSALSARPCSGGAALPGASPPPRTCRLPPTQGLPRARSAALSGNEPEAEKKVAIGRANTEAKWKPMRVELKGIELESYNKAKSDLKDQ